MKNLTLLVLLLLASVTGPVGAQTPLGAEDANAWLDGYMPHALQTSDIAGAVVVIVKDGKILTERGYGFSDVEKRTPVDPQRTLFRPGSVSKLFTWTAVMQMVEQGKIDLDADVNKYLDLKIPARDGKPITMRNLMQHVAGFEEQAKWVITYDPKAPGFDELLKQWVPERVFPAGTTPAYSNYGASLAGYIVQRVSGERFDDYLEKHIFVPLDMKYSTFRQPLPPQLAPLMSKGYSVGSEEPGKYEIVGAAPAGALASSGDDMAHFMIAHLQNGEYNGNRILTAQTAEQMHNSPLTLLPPLNRMELGFFETNINGREVIAHLGDTEQFHTSLHLFLQEGVGFYVSFNSLGKEGAAGELRGALFEDFADRYFPAAGSATAAAETVSTAGLGMGPAPKAAIPAKESAAHAALLAGYWVNSRGSSSNFLAAVGLISQIKVGEDPKKGLITPLKGLNGAPREWVEIAPFVWQDAHGHERLAAEVVNGKAVRWSIDGISPFMVFDRAPWYINAGWLLPMFIGSLIALALTVILWPVTAIVRRRYGATLALDPAALRTYRLSKIGALLLLAATGVWAYTLNSMLGSNGNLSASFDPVIHFAQLFGILGYLGGLVLILLNLRAVWTGMRRWPAKLWSSVLAVSACVCVWVAFAFHLIGLSASY